MDIKVAEVSFFSINSRPKYDKEEEEMHTVDRMSFVTYDMELETMDRLRDAEKLGKIIGVTFHIED